MMITYDKVTKIFGAGAGAITALDNVSFSIDKGEVVVFLGPSGCGKTTTLRLTNRLEALSSGSITVDGNDIESMDAVKLRQSMGYVIQEIGLFPNKTIAENIAVVPKLLGWSKADIEKRVDDLLNMVQLLPVDVYKDRYPAELSGGQQQRVGVARGLAADPDILLMDEPFGAIDPINRDQIQDEFLRVQAKLKKTIAFVSHDIHEAIKMGDKIALFNEGRLVQYDSPEVILTQPKNKFVADFVGADRALKVLGIMRVREAMNKSPKNIVQGSALAPEVLNFMEDKSLRYAVVVHKGKPLGYVSRKDLKYEEGPVRELVEDFPAVVEDKTHLRVALSLMLMHDLILLCVVNESGDLEGTISYQNIQRSILDIYSDETEE
ncbi:MAG: ABC transporter ATP-binding protein [Desulfonatronovibrionaceae bacterium]